MQDPSQNPNVSSWCTVAQYYPKYWWTQHLAPHWLEDGSGCPTKCKPCFSLSDHSPRIREDNHGAKVDIWAIGHLITTSKVADLSEDFKNFGESIREQLNILTAQLDFEFMCKGSQSRYFVAKKNLYIMPKQLVVEIGHYTYIVSSLIVK